MRSITVGAYRIDEVFFIYLKYFATSGNQKPKTCVYVTKGKK